MVVFSWYIKQSLTVFQAKSIQIDDLTRKLNETTLDVDRIREEKDQEIAILQEGMDSTIKQLHEAQQVCRIWSTSKRHY